MKRIATCLLLASTLACTGALAQSVTYVTKNLGFPPTGLPAVDNFASIKLTADNGDLDVTVSAYGLNAFGADASLASILFVVPDGSVFGPCCSDVTGGASVTPELGGGAGFPGVIPAGLELARLDFTESSDLLTNGESVSFKWLGPFNVPNILFFANVLGNDETGAPVSAYYSMEAIAAVPESQTALLLLAGLGLIAFVARRRA